MGLADLIREVGALRTFSVLDIYFFFLYATLSLSFLVFFPFVYVISFLAG